MLNTKEYQSLKEKLTIHEAWVDSIRSRSKCRTCKGSGKGKWNQSECPKCHGKGFTLGWASYKPEDKPANIPDVTNEERSAVEVYEFCQTPPERYFLYISHDDNALSLPDSHNHRTIRNGASGLATTWTGEKLGDVQFGSEFHSAFGDRRVSLRVYAINGKTYSGNYFRDAGSYARVKLCKS